MTITEKIAAFDRAVTATLFQPIQDALSQWRQKSDHLPAIVGFLVSMCLMTLRWILLPAPAEGMGILRACTFSLAIFFDVVICALLYLYSRFMARPSPGLFARSWFARSFVATTFVFVYTFAIIGQPPLIAAINLTENLLYLASFYLAACDLKRPPPPKRREQFALTPSPIRA